MNRYFLSLAIGTSLLGAPLFMGCDKKDEVVKKEEHSDGSGSVKKEETKTDSNGNTKETTKNEVKDANGNKTVDKSTTTTDPNGVTKESKTEHKEK